MNRRGFVKNSLIGMTGLRDFGKTVRQSLAAVVARSRGAALPAGVPRGAGPGQNLFPLTLPSKEWVQFRAAGFNQPACGVIYRRGHEVLHGVPVRGFLHSFVQLAGPRSAPAGEARML